MLGITRWHVFKVLAAILCVAGLTWLGMAYLIPAPPSQITIATSPEGEHYHVLGTRYKGILAETEIDRKSTRLNSSHLGISYAVFCLKKKKKKKNYIVLSLH